jgi:hypothetical protein
MYVKKALQPSASERTPAEANQPEAAAENQTAPAEASGKAAEEQSQSGAPPAVNPEEKGFKYEVLRDQCMKLFGVTKSTFAGAVKNHGGQFKISEVQRQINEWLQKEVR